MFITYFMTETYQVFRKIDELTETGIAIQEELTSIPAIAPENGGDGEWEKAQALLARLSQLGFADSETFAAADDRVSAAKRPNLVATLPGRSDRSRFWIMSHLDVVPPGDSALWKNDPHHMMRKGKRLFGRGVEDNQQGIVSSVMAAAALLELKVPPAQTVKLLFVSDEETGSDYGIKYLLNQHQLFRRDDLVLVPDGGSPDGAMIQIAEKSILWLKFQTKGQQCHAAMPQEGNNAFVAASELVGKLNQLNRIFDQQDPLFDPPASTFSPTKKEANVPNINTIPGDDVFYLDCRILPSVDLADIRKNIREMCRNVERNSGVRITSSPLQELSSRPTSEDSLLVRRLARALQKVRSVTGQVCGIGGGTVASHLRNAGIDTVVWATLDETMHMPNEYCRIENMVADAKVMAYLMLNQE